MTQDIPWEFDLGARKNNYYEEWQSNIRASNLSDMHYDISCAGSSKEPEKADDIRWYLIKYCYQPLSFIVSFQVHNRGPRVSCCKKCNKMCRTHIIYFSIKFIFHLKREMDLCSLEMTLFCSRRYLPLLQFIRWWCQITEPDIFIIWRRCEENKPLQAHTEKKFNDRNDDWLWSLMPHQCLRAR